MTFIFMDKAQVNILKFDSCLQETQCISVEISVGYVKYVLVSN
jgi:hypothetical protein